MLNTLLTRCKSSMNKGRKPNLFLSTSFIVLILPITLLFSLPHLSFAQDNADNGSSDSSGSSDYIGVLQNHSCSSRINRFSESSGSQNHSGSSESSGASESVDN